MFKIAFNSIIVNYPIFLVISLTLAIVEALGFQNAGLSFVTSAFTALFAHQIFVGGITFGWNDLRKKGDPDKFPYWGFGWRFGMLTLVALTLVAPPIVAGMFADTDAKAMLYACAAGIGGIAYAFLLGWIGSILPAVAAGGNRTLKAARQRSRGLRLLTTWRLIYGNVGWAIIIAGVFWGTTQVFDSLTEPTIVNKAIQFALRTVEYFFGMMFTIISACALSMQYLEGEKRLSAA